MTLSNCGKLLKLLLPRIIYIICLALMKNQRYGKNVKDIMDDPHLIKLDQRLYDNGFYIELKIKSTIL
jgi:urease gamma subunit